MNLLPESDEKFAEKEYWDDFFRNRTTSSFEWYGNYPELSTFLHKYVKTKDDVLIVGCGSSDLGANLYDVGYRKIINIDISRIAIRQMNQKNRHRKEMVFLEMDAMNTTFQENSFTAVIDKGTLDALMPKDTEADIDRGRKLIHEMGRILKQGGRYLVVSLLEKHILKLILEETCKLGWMVRLCRCREVEQKTKEEHGQVQMPVFMVICTKLKKIPNMSPILELCLDSDDSCYRTSDQLEVLKAVRDAQDVQAKTNLLQNAQVEEMEMKYVRTGEKTPRYLISIVDAEKFPPRPKYNAFIVPIGRETEWMFSTTEGRQVLRANCKSDRLAVVSLCRDQEYTSREDIQVELRKYLMDFAPPKYAGSVDYLTDGTGLGERKTVYTGNSEFSGDFVVEDVEINGTYFRRLVFLNNQAVIQSEALLKNVEINGKSDRVVDASHVASDYYYHMSLPVALHKDDYARVLVIGLGGGGLCGFIHRNFQYAEITAIDIDPAIVHLAQTYFGLADHPRLHLEIDDGLEFIAACDQNREKINVVMIDVDAKNENQPMSCPPASFLTDDKINQYANILGKKGILVINMVCRVDSVKQEAIKRIRRRFNQFAEYKLEEDLNHIIFASNRNDLTKPQWKQSLKDAFVIVKPQSKDNPEDEHLQHFLKNLV